MIQATYQARQVTKGVVSYLKKAGQLHLLPQVASETLRLARGKADPNQANITSALKLTPSAVTELEGSLNQVFKRELHFHYATDPELIGGLVIKVGDQVIDQSLHSQINQLTRSISL